MNEIRIPLLNDENSSEIHFYADELPEDDSVLIDVLRDVLAPLKIWRSCAVIIISFTLSFVHLYIT